MGRTSDEEGETSTKICKSDEIDDRPLKKARYVWQIKGKYHLKKPDDEKVSCFPTKSPIKDECSSVILPCKHTGFNTDNNCGSELNTMEVSENSAALQDPNTSSEIKINTEPSALLDVTNCEGKNLKVVTPVSQNSPTDQPEWPIALNVMFPNTRPSTSWQLRKWQARQVARCFVDNTINRVLEDMGFVPLPVDADDILDEFPMTESENDEGLEDEAVLMAIHRHGLRTEGEMTGSDTENKIISDAAKIDTAESETCREPRNATNANMPCVCANAPRQDTNAFINLDPFHHRPVFWDQGELDTQKLLHSPFSSELNSNEIVHRWFSDGLFSSVINSESSCDSDMKSLDEPMVDEQTLTKENSSASVNDGVKDNSINADKSDESSSQEKRDANSPSFEHSDFLDKAVAVAIQKKGLSKLSCADYG
ncbi:hypothetical protein R5R35_008420 [Gryllus longicercus]|uniref:Uncharacterized protein n=1 Tax=Gryllus longicercus TaxID=2509291 RepID=A0AAN9VS30_9ORTH